MTRTPAVVLYPFFLGFRYNHVDHEVCLEKGFSDNT